MSEQDIKEYWNYIEKLMELLNKNNKKYIISSVESPIITNYLLWDLINKTNSLNQSINKDTLQEKSDAYAY